MQRERSNDRKPSSSVAKSNSRTIFIVWAPHSMRAKQISKSLGCSVYFLHYKFKRKVYAPFKYPLLFYRSLTILMKERPDIILSQMPPPLCPLAAITYRSIFNKHAIIAADIHTAGLVKPWTYFRSLNKFVMKRSYVVIVTNLEAQQTVAKEYGIATPFILEDKVPDFGNHPPCSGENGKHRRNIITFIQGKEIQKGRNAQISYYHNNNSLTDNKESEKFSVVVPLSFSYDEPIDNILKAAAELPDVTFYLTGDYSRVKRQSLQTNLENVFFTGFLSEENYHLLLGVADGIMALTTRDKTLLAGSYEAIAAEKPLITSNWKPLKRFFTKGTVFVDNSPEQIKSAIQALKGVHSDLEQEMHIFKLEKQQEWETKFTELKARLGLGPASIHTDAT